MGRSILYQLPYGSLFTYVAIVICFVSTGCSAAFYGITPDPNDFRAETLPYCQQIHTATVERNACVHYEDTVRRARALENAYLSVERMNRWSISIGTTWKRYQQRRA